MFKPTCISRISAFLWSVISAENSVLQELQFQEVTVRRILPGGAGVSHYWPYRGFVKCKFNILLEPSSLERDYVLKYSYVRKTLATVLSKWSFHVILLSKVTPRYITLFTKGMSRPFSCNMSLGTLILLQKQIVWVCLSSIFMFQRSHHEFTAVRPRCSLQKRGRSCFSVA
jgi:hypothetical protein